MNWDLINTIVYKLKRISRCMETIQYVLVFLGFTLFMLFVRAAYIKGLQVQEDGKTMRSRANAQERTNQAKMDGLFQLQLSKVADAAADGGHDEFGQILKLVGSMGSMKGSSLDSPGGVSWEVLKEQLKNPEIKKLIIDHQDEALHILKDT